MFLFLSIVVIVGFVALFIYLSNRFYEVNENLKDLESTNGFLAMIDRVSNEAFDAPKKKRGRPRKK